MDQELCNADGQCVGVESPDQLMCGDPPPPPAACAGLNCGDLCELPGEEDVQPDAGEPDLPIAPGGVCNPEGECVPRDEVEEPVCQADLACENLSCGDVCFPEDPGADPAPPGEEEGRGAPPPDNEMENDPQEAPPPFRCSYEGRCVDAENALYCQ